MGALTWWCVKRLQILWKENFYHLMIAVLPGIVGSSIESLYLCLCSEHKSYNLCEYYCLWQVCSCKLVVILYALLPHICLQLSRQDKQIQYPSRKARADARKRVQGRFLKTEGYDSDATDVTWSYWVSCSFAPLRFVNISIPKRFNTM